MFPDCWVDGIIRATLHTLWSGPHHTPPHSAVCRAGEYPDVVVRGVYWAHSTRYVCVVCGEGLSTLVVCVCVVQVTEASIPMTVDVLLNPEAPLALRLSGQLLLGLVRIYSRKVAYLHQVRCCGPAGLNASIRKQACGQCT